MKKKEKNIQRIAAVEDVAGRGRDTLKL